MLLGNTYVVGATGDFISGRSIVTCAKVGQMRKCTKRLCSKIAILEWNKKLC